MQFMLNCTNYAHFINCYKKLCSTNDFKDILQYFRLLYISLVITNYTYE